MGTENGPAILQGKFDFLRPGPETSYYQLVAKRVAQRLYGSGSFWGTPHPVTLVSPNIGSTGTDCTDPSLCPFVGAVPCDLVVGGGPGGAHFAAG